MHSSARLNLLTAYLDSGRNFEIPFIEVLKGVLKRPSTWIGSQYIQKVIAQEDYKIVYITDCALPLYWPSYLPDFDLTKVVTESFYPLDWHFYEIPMTRVRDGDVVLDCGAAEGIFSLRVQNRAKHIVIFEPLPTFVGSMKKTFATCQNVTIVPCALADKEGEAFLEGDSLYGNITHKITSIPVQITTIDNWVLRNNMKIDFIKGDLEGSEFSVLWGAQDTIKQFRPKIAFTVYHPENNWKQMLEFVRSLVPEYQYHLKGISYNKGVPRPVMLHLWC